MDCPVCRIPLIIIERHEIELDYCLKCKGFWFDEGELELVPQALNLKFTLPEFSTFPRAQTKETRRSCPRCNKGMDKILLNENPQIIVDLCRKGDGVWFDASELGMMFEKHIHVKNQAEEKMISFLGEMFHLNAKSTS